MKQVELPAFCDTDPVHPADVVGHAGEHGGLLVGVAALPGHEAGNAVHHILAVHLAVQGASRVTLEVRERNGEREIRMSSLSISLSYKRHLSSSIGDNIDCTTKRL